MQVQVGEEHGNSALSGALRSSDAIQAVLVMRVGRGAEGGRGEGAVGLEDRGSTTLEEGGKKEMKH